MSPEDYARLLSANAQIFSFLAGLCVGSFLNVVIARVPEGLSILRPASRCPKCLTPIAWYDNVPLLGWLMLRGRCRRCRVAISPRYPIIELLVGLLALALERRFGVTPLGFAMFAFVAVLVVVAYIDLDHWFIPLEIVIPTIALGIVTAVFFNHQASWKDAVIGAAAGAAVFQLIGEVGRAVFQRTALGEGDWWLIALIGAFLGWQGLLPVILLASLLGSVVALLLIGLGRGETGRSVEPAPPEPESKPEAAAQPADQPKPLASGLIRGAVAGTTAGLAAGLGFGWMIGLLTGAGVGLACGLSAGYSATHVDEPDDESWVPPARSVPFGPFLVLGALMQLFLGDWLRDLYWHVMSGIVS